MSNHLRLLTAGLLISVLLLTGCAGRQRNKSWDAHNTYLGLVEKQVQPDSTYPTCDGPQKWLDMYWCEAHKEKPNMQKLAALRNERLEMFIQLADKDYARFEKGFNNERSLISLLGDFAGLGLTGAGSAIATVATELSAAATGLQGAKHSFEKNYYDAQTRFVITSKMQALRKDVLTRIRVGELMPAICPEPTGTQPASPCYTLEQGMNDVQEYFHAGSVHRALDSINSDTAKQSKKADEALNVLKGAAQLNK